MFLPSIEASVSNNTEGAIEFGHVAGWVGGWTAEGPNPYVLTTKYSQCIVHEEVCSALLPHVIVL